MSIIIIIAYTAAFPQNGSSSAGIWVISAPDIRQAASTREISLLFEKCCGFFKVPHIGFVEVGRPGPQLNIPTQGQEVAQTGDERPFSFMVPGIRSPAGNRTRATLVWRRRANHLSTPKSFEMCIVLCNDCTFQSPCVKLSTKEDDPEERFCQEHQLHTLYIIVAHYGATLQGYRKVPQIGQHLCFSTLLNALFH